MKLTIVDDGSDIAPNAKGGTELMRDALFARIDPELLEHFQIICSRPGKLDPDKIKILWCHDLAEDTAVSRLADPSYRDQFDLFIFVSNWQMEKYSNQLGVPYSKSIVIENAINPIENCSDKPTDKIKIIYTPTPHRGLELLVPVFEKVSEMFDNIELDVYSSFKLYGWSERDIPYEGLFDRCRGHERINYHGAVSNEEVRSALSQAHIFAYPSIWAETSCICLMEAMSARCVTVHPNYAALPETSGGMTMMYQWCEDPSQHANRFAGNLINAIRMVQQPEINPILDYVKTYTDYRFGWDRRITTWNGVLKSLLQGKLTP
jgi:glycosyltransferase involved in cell wall biosynthesis